MNFNFFKPQQSTILLFDKNSKVFFSYLKQKEYSLLNLEKEINIFVLLKLALKFKRLNLMNYYIEYIRICSPKILITFGTDGAIEAVQDGTGTGCVIIPHYPKVNISITD